MKVIEFLQYSIDLKLLRPLQPLLEGETPQRIPTSCSGHSGFRSTQEVQGTTAYRYNTFILNFMANPMIFRCHYEFPYISLYLESPTPPPKPGPPVERVAEIKFEYHYIHVNLMYPTSLVQHQGTGSHTFTALSCDTTSFRKSKAVASSFLVTVGSDLRSGLSFRCFSSCASPSNSFCNISVNQN